MPLIYTTITLYVKLYANEVLKTGTSSPSGYSYKSEIYISDKGTTTLLSWGYETKGHWSAGYYRCEIWYNNMCLKVLNFKLR
jgi:hypothetical protein